MKLISVQFKFQCCVFHGCSINVSDSNFLWVELHKNRISLGSEMCVEIWHEYLLSRLYHHSAGDWLVYPGERVYLVCLRINRILKTDLLYSVWSISPHMYYISMRVSLSSIKYLFLKLGQTCTCMCMRVGEASDACHVFLLGHHWSAWVKYREWSHTEIVKLIG